MELLTLLLVAVVIGQVATLFTRLDRLQALVGRLAALPSPGDGTQYRAAGSGAASPSGTAVPAASRPAPQRPPPARTPVPPPIPRAEPVRPDPGTSRPRQRDEAARVPPVQPECEAGQPPFLRAGTEQLVGGKAASYAGIIALVIGVVLFVGYAIQHQWIGPAARVLLGLLSGVGLAVMGHVAQTRGRNLDLLARVLTGGGAALFYFSVFAAYHIYHLISAPVAAAGLAASAAAVFWLSLLYASEAVALLGLAGAFLTPHLAGGDFAHGLFPLAFVAVVDIPAILLGIRRNWRVLANAAFVSTGLAGCAWLFAQPDRTLAGNWIAPLAFCCVYYAEFLVLAVARMKRERGEADIAVDLGRLIAGAAGLALAFRVILGTAYPGGTEPVALALVAAAAGHALLIRTLRAAHPVVRREMTVLWFTAVAYVACAVALFFHGVWISLGWAVAGFLLCPLALREQSRALSGLALALGLLGATKALFHDIATFAAAPTLFLNARFATGVLASALLVAQAKRHARNAGPGRLEMAGSIPALAAFLVTALAISDVFWTQGAGGILAWMLTSGILLTAGIACTAAARPETLLHAFGLLLLGLLPLKVLCIDAAITWPDYCARHDAVVNGIIWLRLAMIVAAGWWLHHGTERVADGIRRPARFHASAATIAAALILATAELWRLQNPWRESLVTLLWAAGAMALVVFGLVRQRAGFRFAGLLLFAVTVAKVFLLDFVGLRGLPRAGAFAGVGALLLLLSYAYQRVAPAFAPKGGDAPASRPGNAAAAGDSAP